MNSIYPAGTANNKEALDDGRVAQAFWLWADVLKGSDSEWRMDPANVNATGIIGPTPRFSADIGIDTDGNPYIRGQAGYGTTSSASPAHDAGQPVNATTAAAAKVSPLVWVGLAFLAFKILF